MQIPHIPTQLSKIWKFFLKWPTSCPPAGSWPRLWLWGPLHSSSPPGHTALKSHIHSFTQKHSILIIIFSFLPCIFRPPFSMLSLSAFSGKGSIWFPPPPRVLEAIPTWKVNIEKSTLYKNTNDKKNQNFCRMWNLKFASSQPWSIIYNLSILVLIFLKAWKTFNALHQKIKWTF